MAGLPTDTTGGVGGGDYFKPAMGQNKILIVGDAITGYEYWTSQDKPVRSKEKFTDMPDVKIRQVKNQKTGAMEDKPDTQKFFWAMPVYDFKDQTYKLWQVTQKSIKESLSSLQNNADWGNPVGTYTISIDRKGEGLLTEYSIMANPVKDAKELEAIMKAYKATPIDVAGALFTNSNDF
jgi:hypothetical protein